MSRDGEIAALLRERDGYLQYGKLDRVAAVDEQLQLRGYKNERPETAPPQGRSARPLETANQPTEPEAPAEPKRKGRSRPARDTTED